MWFQDSTENRLAMIKAHGDELRAEAAEHRRAVEEHEGTVTIAVSGRHFHLGSLVIVFGRTIREEKVRRAGARA
jgi:hypothetical protein